MLWMMRLVGLLVGGFLVLRLEGNLVMNITLINIEGQLSSTSRQLIITGGPWELLPIGYYLDNLSVMLMPVMPMLVLDMIEIAEKSLLLLLLLGIGGAHRRSQFW